MSNRITIIIDLIVKLLSYGTKAGVSVAAVQAWQLTQRGQVTGEELLTYVGGPVAGGLLAEGLSWLTAKLKGFMPEKNAAKVAFIESVVAMLNEDRELGMPDELTVTQKRGESVKSATWTKGMFDRVKQVVPAILLALLLCGCVPPLPPTPGPDLPDPNPPAPIVVNDRAETCGAIADAIDAKRIDTTDELIQVFALLTDMGGWSDADSKAVDAVLPKLPTLKRALTADDSAKLRAVK